MKRKKKKKKKKKRKDPGGSTRQKLISSYKKRNETSLFHSGSEAAVIHQVLSEREQHGEPVMKSRSSSKIYLAFFHIYLYSLGWSHGCLSLRPLISGVMVYKQHATLKDVCHVYTFKTLRVSFHAIHMLWVIDVQERMKSGSLNHRSRQVNLVKC